MCVSSKQLAIKNDLIKNAFDATWIKLKIYTVNNCNSYNQVIIT